MNPHRFSRACLHQSTGNFSCLGRRKCKPQISFNMSNAQVIQVACGKPHTQMRKSVTSFRMGNEVASDTLLMELAKELEGACQRAPSPACAAPGEPLIQIFLKASPGHGADSLYTRHGLWTQAWQHLATHAYTSAYVYLSRGTHSEQSLALASPGFLATAPKPNNPSLRRSSSQQEEITGFVLESFLWSLNQPQTLNT